MSDRLFLLYALVMIAIAPIVGWSFGQTDIHPVIAIYLMMFLFSWPLLVVIVRELLK